MTQSKNLMQNSIDSLLLNVLSDEPKYGYQIIRELEKKSQGYFRFKEGTLYPALHRLENAGLVVGTWETIEGGRQRRYYRITEKGLSHLVEKRTEWQDFLWAVNLVIHPEGA